MAHARTRILGAAFLSLFTVASCGEDCDGGIDRVAPKLEVFDPYSDDIEYCTYREDNNIDACAYDFGDVAIGEGRFLKFLVRNSTVVPLKITSLRIESTDADPQFTLADVRTVEKPKDGPVFIKPADINEDAPMKVLGDRELDDDAASAYTEVTVRYTPKFESTANAKLIITSDAVNVGDGTKKDGETVDLIFNLTGNGLDLGRPQIRVEPEACNFGQVGTGVAAFCELTIANDGTRDLAIDTFRFSAETPVALDASGNFDTSLHVFGSQTIVFVPLFVAPGTATTVRLFANPEGVGGASGQLLLHSNDPVNADVTVPLTVEGAVAPTAICKVKSINNVPNTNPSPTVRPLDDVLITAEDSQASTPGATIASFEWWIINKPNESSVDLTTANAMTTRFQFNSSGTVRNGLDVAGTFVIGCRVTDTTGAVSTNDARVTIQSIPSEALHVQLTWDSPLWDYDLHVIKDAGPWCSQNSCYYANCNTNSAFVTLPEWDGIPGETPGDPRLDIDDLSGYGPENINIDAPVNAVYRVGVHAYSPNVSGEVWATLKIYVNGALAFEDSRQMSTGQAFWQAAEVDWANGAATIYPVNQYQASGWTCGF
jgi:hypothetical protein